jgi:hypothetical protein
MAELRLARHQDMIILFGLDWIGFGNENNIRNSKIHDCSYNISSVLMSILSLTEVMPSTSATIC